MSHQGAKYSDTLQWRHCETHSAHQLQGISCALKIKAISRTITNDYGKWPFPLLKPLLWQETLHFSWAKETRKKLRSQGPQVHKEPSPCLKGTDTRPNSSYSAAFPFRRLQCGHDRWCGSLGTWEAEGHCCKQASFGYRVRSCPTPPHHPQIDTSGTPLTGSVNCTTRCYMTWLCDCECVFCTLQRRKRSMVGGQPNLTSC